MTALSALVPQDRAALRTVAGMFPGTVTASVLKLSSTGRTHSVMRERAPATGHTAAFSCNDLRHIIAGFPRKAWV